MENNMNENNGKGQQKAVLRNLTIIDICVILALMIAGTFLKNSGYYVIGEIFRYAVWGYMFKWLFVSFAKRLNMGLKKAVFHPETLAIIAIIGFGVWGVAHAVNLHIKEFGY